jgi:hypothetical protein
MNIDLRKELKQMISDHGHWIVLRQAIPGRKCSCVNDITDDPNPNCTLCLGTGYAYVDRFTKGRKARPIRITQTLGAEQRSSVGVATTPDNIFYLEYNIKPTQQDFILEIDLSATDREPLIPFRVNAVYDISDVRELRDKRGRVEYYAVTAERSAWSEFNLTM